MIKFKEIIFVLLISVLLTIGFTFPAVFNVNKSYIGDGWDNYEFASYQQLVLKQIKESQFPFQQTNYWRYPSGFNFAVGFDSYLTAISGALIGSVVGFPAAYNLTIFLILTLNGLFSYVFFRLLGKSKLLGILGMIVYGFSFYALGKVSSHPNLILCSVFPLFFWSALRLFRKENISFLDLTLFFGSIWLTGLVSAQYFIILLIFIFIYTFVLLFFYKDNWQEIGKKIKLNKRKFIPSFFIFFIGLVFLYSGYFMAMLNHSLLISGREKVLYFSTPSLLDFLLPNPYLKLLIAKFINSGNLPSIEKTVFLGWVEFILFALFFFSRQVRKTKFFIFTLFFIFFILSLGFGKDNNFFLLPYNFLSPFFPFKLIPETGRYFVIFYFFITIGIILLLKSIKNNPLKNIFIFAVILLVAFERIPSQIYSSDSFKNDTYINVVNREKGKAVLDLPLNLLYSPYDILSFSYQKAIVNGYFHWSADTNSSKEFINRQNLLSRYICNDEDPILEDGLDYIKEDGLDREMIDLLKNNEIRTIVVHKDDKFYHSICRNVRLRLSRFLSYIKVLETTSVEKQVEAKTWDGKSSFVIYFPYDGTFYIDGVYIASTDRVSYLIKKDNGVDFSYSWSIKENPYSLELFPKFSINTQVKAGSSLVFYSADNAKNTWFSLWYRYVPINLKNIPLKAVVERIFEDDKATVYRIND